MESIGWRGSQKPPEPTKLGPSAAMLHAFGEAHYTVWHDDEAIVLRVGQPNPALAALLSRLGVQHAALLTADNPFGQRQSAAENEAARESLARMLEATRRPDIPGEGTGDDGQWREPARLSLGMPPDEARNLAVWFRQAAWLQIDATGSPTLEACHYYPPNHHWEPQWPEALRDALDSPLDPAFASMTRPAWPGRSDTGSVILPLPEAGWNSHHTLISFPECVLEPKQELHLTLLSSREAQALAERLEEPTWRAAFEAEHWTLAPTHRACLLHEEKDGKPLHTVIAVVECPALNRFRDTLAQASGLDLPHTIPHVTLLTSQYGRGIGLSSLAEFEARFVRDLSEAERGKLASDTIFEISKETP